MSRNSVDYFSNIPTPTLPRYKRDLGVHNKKITFQHGKLIPWYTRLVYPHSNLKMDMSCFVRMDTSIKVPLDNIYLDNYFFFVPLRILLGSDRFEKILGHKTAYDNNVYNFPVIHMLTDTSDYQHTNVFSMNHNSIIQYMNYGAATNADVQQNYFYNVNKSDISDIWQYNAISDEILNALNLAAYYKVYNEYFRDENLDPEMPIDDLLAGDVYLSDLQYASGSLWQNFEVLPVNRYHDIFSSGLISPVKGGNGDVYIPLGFSQLPVVTGSTHDVNSNSSLSWVKSDGTSPNTSVNTNLVMGSSPNYLTFLDSGGYTFSGNAVEVQPSNLWADASAATGPSVRQLYNSLALFSLYDKRGTFGTRLIEQIRGSFGLEVPDGLIDRAEYLGGSNQSLNNVPILNTADDLGSMRGNSATITGLNSFDKGFNEWGIVIGLTCTRVKHTYGQGILDPTWMLYDNLDLYWPEFANTGKVGNQRRRLFNMSHTNTAVFNYVEPYVDLDVDIDGVAGDFGPFRSESDDLVNYWTYQDVYSAYPVFNATWLKEQSGRIAGTLTGNLIPGATKANGHQFMIRYNWHAQFTIAKPLHSHAPNITGRI